MKRCVLLALVILICLPGSSQQIKKYWSACQDLSTFIATGMAVDQAGNSYVTGYQQDTVVDNYLLHHFFLQKTNKYGVIKWTRTYPVADSFDAGRAISTDDAGNVYVTGERYDTACNICTETIRNSYLFTLKYDGEGNVVWLNTYNGPPSTNQFAANMRVAGDGQVYLISNEKKYNAAQGITENKAITQRLSKGGATLWTRKEAGAIGNGINVDKDGNVLTACSFSPSGIYQTNKFQVYKYDPRGVMQWSKTIDEYQKNGNAYFIAADAQNNIYVNGQSDTIAYYNNPKILTVKLSSSGVLLWSKKEDNATTTLPGYYGDFTIDNQGNSYITGYLRNNSYDRDILTIKRSPTGQLLWRRQFADTLFGPASPIGIALDKADNVYVAGYMYRKSAYVFATLGYDKDGHDLWQKFYTHVQRSNNFPAGLGIDAAGNVYVAGAASGAICTVKYGPTNVTLPKQYVETQQGSLNLYPNPCKDYLFVDLQKPDKNECTYTIADYTGRSLLQSTIVAGGVKGNYAIDVKNLQPGLYIFVLKSSQKTITARFMKQ